MLHTCGEPPLARREIHRVHVVSVCCPRRNVIDTDAAHINGIFAQWCESGENTGENCGGLAGDCRESR